MATRANGELRLDSGSSNPSRGPDAVQARYRCACRDCAFSLEQEHGEGMPALSAKPANNRILIVEPWPGEIRATRCLAAIPE